MFQESPAPELEDRLPRLLPRDHKIRQSTAECQRDLAAAEEALERFRTNWFVSDPPRLDAARRSARQLEAAAAELRATARQLILLTEPARGA